MNNYWFYPNYPMNPNWQQQGHSHYPYREASSTQYLYRRISMEEAMAIAVAQVPGDVVKIELDYENGVLIYEVDILTAQGVKYEVILDVTSGAVLSVEAD